jgi:hypothetical protein
MFDLVLQSLRCRVDIVLLIDGVYTLVDVVIIDPTQVDLVLRVVTIVVTQAKDDLY